MDDLTRINIRTAASRSGRAVAAGAAPAGPTGDGGGRLSGCGGLAGCRGRSGGVWDLVVGQAADGTIGVVIIRDMHPQRGAALAGIPEVLLDGLGVIGDGTGDALGQAAFGLEPFPAVQDLLAGVDPQVALGEPGGDQRRPGPLGLLGVLQDCDQEALRIEDQRPSQAAGSWSDMPKESPRHCVSRDTD